MYIIIGQVHTPFVGTVLLGEEGCIYLVTTVKKLCPRACCGDYLGSLLSQGLGALLSPVVFCAAFPVFFMFVCSAGCENWD